MRYLFKPVYFGRLLAGTCLTVILSGCLQVQVNGPVGGAVVTIARAQYPDTILQRTTSRTEADLIGEFGSEIWASMPPAIKLLYLGSAEIEAEGLDNDTLYLVTASGGVDYDNNFDRLLDDRPTPIEGEWRALMTGEQLKSSLKRVNLLTEAILSVVDGRTHGITSMTSENILELLDFGARQVVPDINRDGAVRYADVLRWDGAYSRDSYLGEDVALNEFALTIVNNDPPDLAWVTNQLLGARRYENILAENPDLAVCSRNGDRYVFTHEIGELTCGPSMYLPTDGSLEGIDAFPQLQTLRLRDPAFTDFTPLLNLPSLEVLEVRTDYQSPGAVPTGDALSVLAGLPGLRKLILPSSTLDRYDWLAALDQVESVSWQIPTEDFESAFDVLTAMPGLVDLKLEAAELSPAQLARFTELSGLRRLYLRTGYMNLDMAALPALPDLESLTVATRDVSNLEALTSYTSLRYLDLPFAEVRDLSPLLGLMNLKYLNLSGSPVEDWSGIGALSSLKNLNASFSGLSSLEHFRSLNSLQELNVSSNPIVSLEGIESLGNLRVLNISDTQLTNLDMAANIPNLEELNAGRIGLTSVQGIQGAPSLKRLGLWRNQLTTTEGIRDLPALKYLDLTENSLVAIPGLAELPAIKEIYLFRNPGIPCAELFALREALAGRAGAYTPDCTP